MRRSPSLNTSWYIETGQGMGETLTIASRKQAYTLADRGTFLATDSLDLKLLLEGGKDLLNPYHVIVVRGDQVNRGCAQEFSTWITSPATQREIGRFGGAEYGEPLFFPDAKGGWTPSTRCSAARRSSQCATAIALALASRSGHGSRSRTGAAGACSRPR